MLSSILFGTLLGAISVQFLGSQIRKSDKVSARQSFHQNTVVQQPNSNVPSRSYVPRSS